MAEMQDVMIQVVTQVQNQKKNLQAQVLGPLNQALLAQLNREAKPDPSIVQDLP